MTRLLWGGGGGAGGGAVAVSDSLTNEFNLRPQRVFVHSPRLKYLLSQISVTIKQKRIIYNVAAVKEYSDKRANCTIQD